MNAYVTTGIRELTAQELDQVTGGRGAEMDQTEMIAAGLTIGWLIGTAIGSLLSWLFD
jgi:hypothetical protein